MNVKTTTESLCDQLKKFFAKQMEKERRAEIEEAARQIANAGAAKEAAKAAAVREAAREGGQVNFGLVYLGVLIFFASIFIFFNLWRSRISRRAGPVTQIPKTPISNENLLKWDLWDCGRNDIKRARVYYDALSEVNGCNKKLKKIMKVVFNLRAFPYFSNQARVISIRMDGFENGAEFHEFKPADGLIPGSHFAYQMFGDDTIQVTRYVVGSKSYLAGFCIYIKEYVGGVDISMDVIKKLIKEAKYPGKEVVEKGLEEELEDKKDVEDTVPSKFAIGELSSQGSGPEIEQNDVPPSYSSLSIMNLENTTDSLCDQLKQFVAKQMEKERKAEIEEAARQAANAIAAKEAAKAAAAREAANAVAAREAAKAAAAQEAANAEAAKVAAIFGLVIVILVALGFLLYYLWLRWKSKRAGPVTRTPKTLISKEDLWEYRKNKISMTNNYYNKYSTFVNCCTGKLKEIMRVVFNLKKDTPVFLSNTTRVISIRMDGFINGQEFYDFEPTDGLIAGTHFTYQMFGVDTIQVTRYVVGNKSYLAGFCIYVKNDSVWSIEINMNVIKKLMEEEKYPGREAAKKEMKEELQKMDGRNTNISEEKETGKDVVPSQFTFNFWKRSSHGSEMKAEQSDVPTSHSSRAGPVTRIPKTPISKENLWKDSTNKISMANVYYDSNSYYNNNGCTRKLEKIMRVVLNLTRDVPVYLSNATRVISIRMEGFSNGAEFHSFKPADGMIPGSHFTYQIFGDDTIQVTRYVVGNKSYVAGFCIYVEDDSVEDDDINMNVIKKLMKEEKYPGKEAAEKELKEELERMKAGNEEKYPGKGAAEKEVKEELEDEIASKFTFKCWKRTPQGSGTNTEQSDVPPSYSSLSLV
ncbi:unnamed protein product [Caenorhabditis brenneri]